MAKTTLGQRITMASKQRGMDAKELARQIGTTKWMAERWQTDKTNPSLPYVYKIQEALGVTMDWLLLGKGPRR
jgi:transcriptional regulator with XRE-family HTH domain